MKKPNVDQLCEVLRHGDDSQYNILLLMPNGDFKLYQGAGGNAVSHINYVTRWETFDAGNGYVGEDAAEDVAFYEKLVMPWALEAWEIYKKTGELQIVNLYS